jgi:hypothetical protein
MRSSRKRVFSMRRLLQRSLWVNPASLTLACLAAVLSVYAYDLHIFELIEMKTYDLRFVSQGPEKPSPAG